MNKKWALVLLLIGVCFSCELALACSCIGHRRPCELLNSDTVFVGTVVETVGVKRAIKSPTGEDSFTYGFDMRFRVEETLKGHTAPEQIVETGSGGGDCGTPFSPGTRLIIFAYREKDGSLSTGMCSGNRMLDGIHDDEVIAPIRALTKSKGKGSVYGSVFKGTPKIDEYGSIEEGNEKPWPKVHVLLASNELGLDAVTASDGSFEFQNLPNGTYTLKPAISDRFDYSHEYQENYTVSIADGSCGYVNLRVYPNTRIRGRVTFPDGAPAKPTKIVAFPTSMQSVGVYAGAWDYTGEDGTFDLWPLVPGDYLVAININKPPADDSPYPTTFYPGVPLRSAAAVIRVGEGEVANVEFHVPNLLHKRKVSINLLTTESKQASGKDLHITVEDITYPSDEVTDLEADEHGFKLLELFAGRRYRIGAYRLTPGGTKNCSKEVKLEEGTSPKTLTLVLDGSTCRF